MRNIKELTRLLNDSVSNLKAQDLIHTSPVDKPVSSFMQKEGLEDVVKSAVRKKTNAKDQEIGRAHV